MMLAFQRYSVTVYEIIEQEALHYCYSQMLHPK